MGFKAKTSILCVCEFALNPHDEVIAQRFKISARSSECIKRVYELDIAGKVEAVRKFFDFAVACIKRA